MVIPIPTITQYPDCEQDFDKFTIKQIYSNLDAKKVQDAVKLDSISNSIVIYTNDMAFLDQQISMLIVIDQDDVD